MRIAKLKDAITNPEQPTVPKEYNLAVAAYEDAGYHLTGSDFPKFQNIKSALYEHRNKVAGVKKIEHKNIKEVVVPPKFKSFLLADFDDDDTRILVFGSERARRHMETLKDFFGDGTFKSCCPPFYQLYTIHADIGSTEDVTNIVPLLYALMSNKTKKSYNILFSMLKSTLPGWNPQTFKCDFEKATMHAIREILPGVTVKGCFFHYTKAIWKKGRQLGLTKTKLMKRQVALAAVLPLLPENQIMAGWFYVASQSPDDVKSAQFRRYMLNHWIKEEFLSVICVYSERHRTTNFLEGWHNKINKALSKKRPSLLKLLHFLNVNDLIFLRTEPRSSLNRQRLQRSKERDQFIFQTQRELADGHITLEHFLEKMR